eukprot:s2947_g9.t1
MPIESQARCLCSRHQSAKGKRFRTYPELAVVRRCKIVVLGLEIGGRFSHEAVAFRRQLAQGMLAVAAQRALASSLLELPLVGEQTSATARNTFG